MMQTKIWMVLARRGSCVQYWFMTGFHTSLLECSELWSVFKAGPDKKCCTICPLFIYILDNDSINGYLLAARQVRTYNTVSRQQLR